jgi:hypothetical protein
MFSYTDIFDTDLCCSYGKCPAKFNLQPGDRLEIRKIYDVQFQTDTFHVFSGSTFIGYLHPSVDKYLLHWLKRGIYYNCVVKEIHSYSIAVIFYDRNCGFSYPDLF